MQVVFRVGLTVCWTIANSIQQKALVSQKTNIKITIGHYTFNSFPFLRT